MKRSRPKEPGADDDWEARKSQMYVCPKCRTEDYASSNTPERPPCPECGEPMDLQS
jgi:hypothetical protein